MLCGLLPRALIVVLLTPRGPSTVARLVVSVVVRESIDGMKRGRFRPHVGEEVRKLQPTAANHDPTIAVVLETDVLRVRAPLDQRDPAAILGRLRTVAGVTVREVTTVREFVAQASAGATISAS